MAFNDATVSGEKRFCCVRGGRMEKRKGGAVTFAPLLARLVASASMIAIAGPGALVVTSTGASAQSTCSGGGGTYSCTGPAPAATTTQSLTGAPLDVDVDATFTIDTVAGDAFNLVGNGGVSFTQVPGGASIEGAEDGIDAQNANPGDLTITTTGAVTGGVIGVQARQTGDGFLSVNAAGPVSGGSYGIFADQQGVGALSVTTSGAVSGTSAYGVYVSGGANATGLAVDAQGDVSGGGDGVFAFHFGSGDVSVTTAGAVTGTASNGIFISSQANSASLTVNADGAVTGGQNGVFATNAGSGDTTVTTGAGDVTGNGASNDGIFVANASAGGALSVTTGAGAVTGGQDGVEALKNGAGDLEVTVGGDVSGQNRFGVRAVNAATGGLGQTRIAQSAGSTITGATDGVSVENVSSVLTIETLGAVVGTAGDGIAATNAASAIDLTVVANAVEGGNDGVSARNLGAGRLRIETSGVIVGQNNDGIDAENSGTDLTIVANGPTTGGVAAIRATQNGSGTLSVTTNGAATGGADGVVATNTGAGATRIALRDETTGMTGYGVRMSSVNGSELTVADGARVSGGAGAVFFDGASAGAAANDRLRLETGGALEAAAFLNAGDDTFDWLGGEFTRVVGGEGTDTVNFAAPGRRLENSGAAGDALEGFEIYNFDAGGFDLAGAHVGLEAVNFRAGVNRLSGSLDAAAVSILNGATLNAGDGARLTGSLTNAGVLDIGDSPGTFTIDGDFVQTADGVLPVEISGETGDLLIVTGDVTLGGALEVSILGDLGEGPQRRIIIDGRSNISGAFDQTPVSGGLLLSNAVEVDAPNADVVLVTTVRAAGDIDGVNVNAANAGDNLMDSLRAPVVAGGFGALANAVGRISDAGTLARVLDNLHAEPLDMGLRFLTNAQERFFDAARAQVRRAVDGPHIWGAFEVFQIDQDRSAQHIGFDGEARQFAMGVSGIRSGPVRLGVSGGYTNFNSESDGPLGDEAEGEHMHLAGNLSADLNAAGARGLRWGVDAGLGLAVGENEIAMRLIDPVADRQVVQRGRADVSNLQGEARLSLNGANGADWPVKPYVMAGFDHYTQDALTINGAGATALAVEKLSNTRGRAGAGVAFEHRPAENLSLRARAGGVQYFGDTQNIFVTRFAAAPADASSFNAFGLDIRQQAVFDANITYTHKSGFSFDAGLFGETGDLTLYGASARLSKRF